MGWRIFLLFLLALPILAADEDLAPDGDDDAAMTTAGSTVEDNGCTNSCTNGTDCYTQIDEAPDGAADTGCGGNGCITVSDAAGAGEQMVVTFPTPSQDPSTATDAQRFHILASKCLDTSCQEDSGGSGTPPLYVYLWCNSVLYAGPEIGNAICVIADIAGDNQSVTCDWTMPGVGDCAVNGSDVAVGLGVSREAGGPNERWSCHEAVEWEVTWASAVTPRLFFVD